MEIDATQLQRISGEFKVMNERLERRSNHHSSRAQLLGVAYVIYESLIYLSVSKTCVLQCNQWFIPFFLALLPSFVFWVSFADAVTSYYDARYELDLNIIRYEMIRCYRHDRERLNEQVIRPDGYILFKRLLFIWTIVLALIGFTAMVLWSFRLILCGK